jgi:hypothetical protein
MQAVIGQAATTDASTRCSGCAAPTLPPAGFYNAIIRSNLVSPGVRVEATPDKRTELMASLRLSWLAARQDAFSFTGVRDATGRSGSFAGSQLNRRVRHQLSKASRLEFDAVVFAKGRFLGTAPNAMLERWTRYNAAQRDRSFLSGSRAAEKRTSVEAPALA